jgi:excisionase family DNA binding protein
VQNDTTTSPLLVGTDEAARRLGVSALWLKREVTAGRVQHTKQGRLTKFSAADLDAFIADRVVRPTNRAKTA